MSDQESFLTRWSRRKRATGAETESTAGEARSHPPAPLGGEGRPLERSESGRGGGDYSRSELAQTPPTPDPSPPRASRAGGGEPRESSKERDPADFDPASLPSLESINAGTDIRAFLAPGVPAELTRAALRRAWSADPAIRDFIGPAENAWDFTAPDGVPGFASLSADEVQRLAAQFFGPEPAKEDAAVQTESPSSETVALADSERAPVPQSSDPPATPVESAPVEENAAAEEKSPTESPRRRHGGALAE